MVEGGVKPPVETPAERLRGEEEEHRERYQEWCDAEDGEANRLGPGDDDDLEDVVLGAPACSTGEACESCQ